MNEDKKVYTPPHPAHVVVSRWRVFEDTAPGYWGIELENAGNDDDPIMYPIKIHRERVAIVVDAHNAALSARHLVGYQDRVAAAHHALFHDDPTDVAERVARFLEEAMETAQAFGMTLDDVRMQADYTFNRPAGEPAKEIGAALLTLASLCVVAGHDMMACGEADLEKLQRPETIARIRAKRATRHGRGPLPGLDPSASAEVEG